MSKLLLPAGLSLGDARRRVNGARLFPPRLLSDGAAPASSSRPNVTATASATPHTPGSWTEHIATLSEDVGWVQITPAGSTASAATDTSTLWDLGVGAAGSEVAALPQLGVGWYSTASNLFHLGWLFPLFIPKGSRTAVRCQSAVGAKAAAVRVWYYAADQIARPSSKIVPIGVNTATSRGVDLSAPGAINTESAWTQITAATTEPFVGLGMAVQGGGNTTMASGTALVDVAIGSAGNEIPIISDVMFTPNNAEQISYVSPVVHPAVIPAGTRLSARYQIAALGGSFDLILYGIRPAA